MIELVDKQYLDDGRDSYCVWDSANSYYKKTLLHSETSTKFEKRYSFIHRGRKTLFCDLDALRGEVVFSRAWRFVQFVKADLLTDEDYFYLELMGNKRLDI